MEVRVIMKPEEMKKLGNNPEKFVAISDHFVRMLYFLCIKDTMGFSKEVNEMKYKLQKMGDDPFLHAMINEIIRNMLRGYLNSTATNFTLNGG